MHIWPGDVTASTVQFMQKSRAALLSRRPTGCRRDWFVGSVASLSAADLQPHDILSGTYDVQSYVPGAFFLVAQE